MKDRIKKIRKELDLTQQAFADRIGIKRNTLGQYEIGRNEPIEAIIISICKEFNVNEEWLRTGQGDMFKASPSSTLDKLAEEYGLEHESYIIIEKFLNLKPDIRSGLISYFKEVAIDINIIKNI